MKLLAGILFASISCLSFNAIANESHNPAIQKANSTLIKEGDILEILMTIDKNEMNAAKVALEKSSNPKVTHFAEHMQRDHSKNLSETQSLGAEQKVQPVPSSLSNTLHSQGEKELVQLKDLNGKAFDMAYMKAMVKGHKAALEIIRSKLIPNAKNNEQLSNHLQATQSTVEGHLEMAEKTLKAI